MCAPRAHEQARGVEGALRRRNHGRTSSLLESVCAHSGAHSPLHRATRATSSSTRQGRCVALRRRVCVIPHASRVHGETMCVTTHGSRSIARGLFDTHSLRQRRVAAGDPRSPTVAVVTGRSRLRHAHRDRARVAPRCASGRAPGSDGHDAPGRSSSSSPSSSKSDPQPLHRSRITCSHKTGAMRDAHAAHAMSPRALTPEFLSVWGSR